MLLRNYYNSRNCLRFHEFESGFHTHFTAAYDEAMQNSFGGDASGACYIFPRRIAGDSLICELKGRGKFTHLTGWQSLPLDSVALPDGSHPSIMFALPQKTQRIPTQRPCRFGHEFATHRYWVEEIATTITLRNGCVPPRRKAGAERLAEQLRRAGYKARVVVSWRRDSRYEVEVLREEAFLPWRQERWGTWYPTAQVQL